MRIAHATGGGEEGRVITAHGLTKGFRVRAGTGQGCNCAPNRANVDLSPLQWTLERLVTGYQLPTRGDRRLAKVNMLWFADGANTVAMSASAASVALGVTWMVAWMSGNQVGVAEDGSKTAFSVSGPATGKGGGADGHSAPVRDGAAERRAGAVRACANTNS